MSNQFDQLASQSILVADTGDIEAIRRYQPTDATTNPSLLMKAAQLPQYQHLVDEAIIFSAQFSKKERLKWCMDRLAVNFGTEILKIVPGVVSVEVDASIAFKPKRTANRARRMIKMFEDRGISRERILIKIAATWYGIKAAEILEKEGIHCNLTLIFNLPAQAAACAEAKVTLISPFVGRVSDWHKKNGSIPSDPAQDPGVVLVRSIYNYYKKYGYSTVVMAASFRNKNQITELAGCDKITISPKLLGELKDSKDAVPRKLSPPAQPVENPKAPNDDRHWYQRMCRDAMALDKLHEGIRKFIADQKKLEKFIKQKIAMQTPTARM